jgi:hypothetical protein
MDRRDGATGPDADRKGESLTNDELTSVIAIRWNDTPLSAAMKPSAVKRAFQVLRVEKPSKWRTSQAVPDCLPMAGQGLGMFACFDFRGDREFVL